MIVGYRSYRLQSMNDFFPPYLQIRKQIDQWNSNENLPSLSSLCRLCVSVLGWWQCPSTSLSSTLSSRLTRYYTTECPVSGRTGPVINAERSWWEGRVTAVRRDQRLFNSAWRQTPPPRFPPSTKHSFIKKSPTLTGLYRQWC